MRASLIEVASLSVNSSPVRTRCTFDAVVDTERNPRCRRACNKEEIKSTQSAQGEEARAELHLAILPL
jgi:hypothetical protein